jgi:hypothetical protein
MLVMPNLLFFKKDRKESPGLLKPGLFSFPKHQSDVRPYAAQI